MSISLADLRFQWQRALGLVRRGTTSLRARGWRATWARVKRQFERVPLTQRAALYFPQDAPFAPFAVPDSEAPRASLIIPVYNQVAHTLTCLRALAEHPPLATCEILVIDDGSSDQTQAWMGQVAGLHFHRRAQNGGFIAACNDGAARARGEVLVFLNNDTVPQPGWLDALLDTFRTQPRAGLVGAQLIYPDGRLQEAGGVVRDDGRADNLGRFQSPLHPAFSYLRQVDYCSGAAIAVPAALFAEAGGFDTHFSPAYYEDTDLGLRLRSLGHDVLYQPASKVVHLEGITAGTDPNAGIKAYQVRNREKFEARWRHALPSHPDHEAPVVELTRQHYRRQVLIVDALTPRPDHDSGSLRMFNLMRLLREQGAHVVFLAANRQHGGRYTEALQQLGVEAWYAPFAARAPAWLREHGPRFDVVLLSRHYVASEFLPLVKRHAPQARIVFDSVDLHYLREARGAEMAGDAGLRAAALRTRDSELKVIADADVTLVVSTMERELLAADAPAAHIELLSNLHEVAGAGASFAQRHDLVFVGGFRHPPNVDAVVWFAGQVMPLLRARLPDVVFHCVGSDPPDAVRALAGREGVVVHGHVPDLVPMMESLRIAVAPLRYGAGVKGKVNLSMAHGQPVVATTTAVEGMHLADGVDVLVADDPQGFADAVAGLYQDEALWNLLSRNGLDNVARHFSMQAAREVVDKVFFAS
ncbi:glycosyltransferase [Pseudoxanthomonas gei]|uniref:Glycosyltransferase n=1 Tax=Pseudoxanthomonas gei TaxID=1383030 RepID=A0ABX0AF99_9GAMM|nr:glycosyltransferase [Pseudoxanthomonas gei]NDK38156.1 glycosyltransferase [Pseudoxanthomonas gei]